MQEEPQISFGCLSEGNIKLAISYAIRPIFEPNWIRGVLRPENRSCVVTVCSDPTVSGDSGHMAFNCSPRIGGTVTRDLKDEASATTTCLSNNLETSSPESAVVRRYGIMVVCMGFEPAISRMVAGLVADMLLGLTQREAELLQEPSSVLSAA